MSRYRNPGDLAYADWIVKFAPKEAAFFDLRHTADRQDGAIPAKSRELTSLAVAPTARCASCIDAHAENAVQARATREEAAETVSIAAALRAGGVVGDGLRAMRRFDEAADA